MATQVLKGCGGFYRLDDKHRAEGLSKIKERINFHQLNTTAPKIRIIGKSKEDTTIVGTDRATQSTIDRYETVWKAALDFCIEISDFDSAMIFARDLCPADPIPMSADTAICAFAFMCNPREPS